MLFISAENNSGDHALIPLYVLPAVFDATVSGNDGGRHLTFTAPDSPIRGVCLPMFSQGDQRQPLWLPVRREYAGRPRFISLPMYERVWTEWFFEPCGGRYDPERVVELPKTGVEFPMKQVLSVYLMLRRLMYRYRSEYGDLAFIAQGRAVPAITKNIVFSAFARRPLGLGPGEEIDEPRRLLLHELLTVDLTTQRLELVKPWRHGEQ